VVSTGTGIPIFTINNATAILGQDNALSADTDVAVNGGVLNFNGHVSTIGDLTLTADGQVSATAIDNTTTTVAAGTLTAVSIVCDTLVIGSPSAAAAAAPQQVAASAARAFDSTASAALGQSFAAPRIPAIALTAAPQLVAPVSVANLPAISISPMTVPAVSVVRRAASAAVLEPVAHLAATGLPAQTEPRARESLIVQPLVAESRNWQLGAGLYLATLAELQDANAFPQPSSPLERQSDRLETFLVDAAAEAKLSTSAAPVGREAWQFALQSLLQELQPEKTAESAESALLAHRHSRKSGMLAQQAVDKFYAGLLDSDPATDARG
jgi:hypothetical protein